MFALPARFRAKGKVQVTLQRREGKGSRKIPVSRNVVRSIQSILFTGRQREMIKKFAIFGLAMMLVMAFAGVAGASSPQAKCADIGGVHSQSGGTHYCHVEGDSLTETTLYAGQSGNGWVVEYEVTKTYTYHAPTQTYILQSTGEPVIIACYNPGEKTMDPSHKNCQLP
jgi:hypothetical protein